MFEKVLFIETLCFIIKDYVLNLNITTLKLIYYYYLSICNNTIYVFKYERIKKIQDYVSRNSHICFLTKPKAASPSYTAVSSHNVNFHPVRYIT